MTWDWVNVVVLEDVYEENAVRVLDEILNAGIRSYMDIGSGTLEHSMKFINIM